MPDTLSRLQREVAALEAGGCPDRAAAIQELLARLCGHPWGTHEERSQAQGLVARLERLKWAESPPAVKQVGPATLDPLTRLGFRGKGRPQAG